MDNFLKGLALGFVVTAWMCIYLSGLYRDPRIEKEWHDEAIKQGHAEYYLDENNERQWRWKDCEREREEEN